MDPTLNPTSVCELCQPVLMQPVEDLSATVEIMQKTITALNDRLPESVELLRVLQGTDFVAAAKQGQRNAARITALDERVSSMEDASSEKASSGLHPTKSLYVEYKDDLVLLMLASNLALVTYMICCRKSYGAVKYTRVQLSSGEEDGRSDNQDML